MLALLLAGCSDQNVAAVSLDAIANVTGDFDDVTQLLAAEDIGHADFNGYIARATWDTSDDPPTKDTPGNSFEQLLTSTEDNGDASIDAFNAVFINSGARGLGSTVYNDVTTADDTILLDDTMVEGACGFAERGGTLVVSDWAYDLVEACWPDEIEFLNDDTVADAAQVGDAGEVVATLAGQDTIDAVGADTFLFEFNFSAFSIMESVADDVTVLATGDVEYEESASVGTASLTGVPLLVRFPVGKNDGLVVFSSFAWLPQNSTQGQALLLTAVTGLEPGAGSQSAEASGG